jgi:hypothetical protein
VCGATFSILDIDGLDCACTSSLVPDANSAIGAIECTVAEGCLGSNDMFCGQGDMNGSIEAGENGIGVQMTSCVNLDVNVPSDMLGKNGTYDVCVNASSNPGSWGFDECAATFQGENCDCTVCDNFGVMFDCSDLGGPNMLMCTSLNFKAKEVMEPEEVMDTDDEEVMDTDDEEVMDTDDEEFMDTKEAKGTKSEKKSKNDNMW